MDKSEIDLAYEALAKRRDDEARRRRERRKLREVVQALHGVGGFYLEHGDADQEDLRRFGRRWASKWLTAGPVYRSLGLTTTRDIITPKEPGQQIAQGLFEMVVRGCSRRSFETALCGALMKLEEDSRALWSLRTFFDALARRVAGLGAEKPVVSARPELDPTDVRILKELQRAPKKRLLTSEIADLLGRPGNNIGKNLSKLRKLDALENRPRKGYRITELGRSWCGPRKLRSFPARRPAPLTAPLGEGAARPRSSAAASAGREARRRPRLTP